MTVRPGPVRPPDVMAVPPGALGRTLSESPPLRATAVRAPETMPPGSGTERGVAPLTRDGEFEPDVGMRLGARETVDDPELLEPELGGFDSPPPEPELVELEPPEPALDPPDDPELDEPEELPRGTACAPATPGAARTKAMTRLSARRVDLGMVRSPEAPRRNLLHHGTLVQLYCHCVPAANA
ncbi:MAG: hypothetical protein ACM4AI_21745 [Acidobacteriota bacterium]